MATLRVGMPGTAVKGFSVTVPSAIENVVTCSDVYALCNVHRVRIGYGIDLRLQPLSLYKIVKSPDLRMLQCKVEETFRTWGQKYERYSVMHEHERKAADVEAMNLNVNALMATLRDLLAYSSTINPAVDWVTLQRKASFCSTPEERNEMPPWLQLGPTGLPTGFERASGPGAENQRRQKIFVKAQAAWRKRHLTFDREERLRQESLLQVRRQYKKGAKPKVVEDYCSLVLANSRYPDGFPRAWTLDYRPESKLLVVAIDLPKPDDLPAVDSYKYVKTQRAIVERPLSASARKKLYDSVLYQVCLRTLHELFRADAIGAIEAIGFNGVVTTCNKATGAEQAKIILSIVSDKARFENIELTKVDPKATFKHLKGVAAADLSGLTPIPPVITLDKSDKRFIEGRSVDVDCSTNLAAMHWDDFEHLIRELFEFELGRGGEVRVTQASRDGGVDAVAFDPDPIRGGKIIIQAKRYTNTVDVSSVRDLYGTVMNEGAIKGILVTTSDYGKDSYEFAKNKPIALLSGSNLLALLAKHGRVARIDIAEAKKMMIGM